MAQTQKKFPLSTGKTSWNTSVTQSWTVQEATSASGKRRTLVQQTYPAWKFSLKFPALARSDVDTLMDFYSQMRGKWGSFLYQDYENHHIEAGEVVRTGATCYCTTNTATFREPAAYVENLHVFIDGEETTDFTLTNATFVLATEPTSEQVVTATYDFYYRVSFGGDLQISETFTDLYTVSLTLEVERE